MKKLYSIALAAACALSATAVTPQKLAKIQNAEQADVENTVLKVRTAEQNLGVKTSISTLATIESYADYKWASIGTGRYQSSVVSDTYGGTNPIEEVEVFEDAAHPGVYKLVGVWSEFVNDGELIIDASNPAFITVPKQYTGIIDNVDGPTYIASQTWTLSELSGYTPDQIIAGIPNYLPVFEDGIITFPVRSLVLNWPEADINGAYETDPESWYVGKSSGVFVLPGTEFVEPWTLYGEGTVSGDVYFNLFQATPSDYSVDVYVATTDPTQFKIINPLKGLYAALGFNAASPDWELDATDPSNIVISLVSTGINGGATDGLYYACSMSFNQQDPTNTPEVARISITEGESSSTITIPSKSLLLYASTAGKLYYGNSTEASINISRKSGVKDITTSNDENAPAEYYNLQGVRISNPAAGQLLIKKQGNTVSKVLVK